MNTAKNILLITIIIVLIYLCIKVIPNISLPEGCGYSSPFWEVCLGIGREDEPSKCLDIVTRNCDKPRTMVIENRCRTPFSIKGEEYKERSNIFTIGTGAYSIDIEMDGKILTVKGNESASLCTK